MTNRYITTFGQFIVANASPKHSCSQHEVTRGQECGLLVIPQSHSDPSDLVSQIQRPIEPQIAPSSDQSQRRRTVPATQTFTSTSTFVVSLTATTLVPQTATTSVTSESTVLVTSATDTTTLTLQSITTSVTTQTVPFQKRQVTVSATSIPAYASPCGNAAQYSSACSCLGVSSRVTTTVAGRSTTVSRSTTVPSPQTVSTTASTASVPTTVATNTQTVQTTTTSFSLFVSETTTTTTSTAVSTSTSVAACQPGNNVVNGGFESGVLDPWSYTSNGGSFGVVESGGAYAGTYRFRNALTSPDYVAGRFYIAQTVPVCPGQRYRFQATGRLAGPASGSAICFYYFCFGDNCLGPAFAPNTAWSTASVFVTAGPAQTSAVIKIGNALSAGQSCAFDFLFDAVSLTPESV
jgi:hypothetical protein